MDIGDLFSPSFTEDGRVRVGDEELSPGERCEDTTLRAVLPGEPPLAVFESDEGRMLFVTDTGPQMVLAPFMEEAGADALDAAFFEGLMTADTDPLAEQLLAEGEPTYQAVAAALPRVVDYAFVGDPRVDERTIVAADGSIEGLLGPLTDMPWDELRTRGRWGIVDVRLPLPMLWVQTGINAFAEQIVIATLGGDGKLRTLARRRVSDGDDETVEYLAPGSDQPADAEEFYAGLMTIWGQTVAFDLTMMSVETNDQLLVDLAFSSLCLGDLTPRGCLPRYGIGVYDEPRHHGFPPATLQLAHCLLDWGNFERGRDLLSAYTDAFVNLDGTFDYYGPALSEYGQFLALVLRYVELSGDTAWWMHRQATLRRVWSRLMTLRRESVANTDAPDNCRGLVPGLPEADYHTDEAQWRQYYFSGDAWAVRGLQSMAALLVSVGQFEEGLTVSTEADAWAEDLKRAVAASIVDTGGDPFVPPGPTQLEPFEHMTESRHASFVNYRYWAEMISAGVLEPDAMRQVMDYRSSHGGELLAMTRFGDHLDDWPVINYARALLELGEIDRYLLLMYAHLTQHQAAGWLTAYEQVTLLPDEHGLRRQHAGQVSPCQTTVPQMLCWALAYEMRDDNLLLIAPAVPWHWITDHPVEVAGLPTRWGDIVLDIGAMDKRVIVDLELPEGFGAAIRVRVPTPDRAPLTAVTVNGEPYLGYDADARLVDLVELEEEVRIDATF
jgi:hypothetical protein